MKKVISKISKILTAIVITAMLVFADTESTNAAAKSVKVGSTTLLSGYVAGTRFSIKPLVGGGYGYCLNIHKGSAKNTTQYLQKEMGAGMAYILKNGYPNKSFTGNKSKDYYITQAAVWWFLDDTTGTSYLSKSFKTKGTDKSGLRKYIKKLVSGAKTAKKQGYSTPSLNVKVSTKKTTLGSGKKYYVSKPIDANAKNIDGKYKVTVTSGPKGTITTDVNGHHQSSFKANEKFLIKIPVSKIGEGKTVNAKVKVTASSTIKKAYKYAPKNNNIQPMVVLQPYTKTVSDTITVSATRPKPGKNIVVPTPIPTTQPTPASVSIIKLDRDTNAVVEGAVLSVKNSSGKEVARFTSTTEAYKMNNVANGTYTVEEVQAPAGYELSKEKQTFTISDTERTAEVRYYNKAKESVVSIFKLDKNTEKPVAGAGLVIKDANGNVVRSLTSSVNGNSITGLANGTYTVEEVEAPAGYELSTEKETFTLSNETKSVSVKFYNKAKESVVSIIKLDKTTDKPVSGAVLEIKDANGNVIKKFTSSVNGNSITGLSNGTYTVEEVEAPAGYELSTEKETFTLSDDVKSVEVKFYNTPKDRVVTISKVDSTTGKPVAGAVIVVTNEAGEEVARFTSTTEAYVIKNIADGTYTVEEEEAPEGYFLNEESQTFTIDSEHLSYQVTIEDVPKTCENGGKDDDECYVEVPDTASSSLPFCLIGIAIVSSGIAYVYKNNKKAHK